MSFKKPFRAKPVRLGPYHRAVKRRKQIASTASTLGIALVGGLIGGSLMGLYERGSGARVQAIGTFDENLKVRANGSNLAPSHEAVERSIPLQETYWANCSEARAAGVTPLYAGEPGYRSQLDRDNDGVACEPYRGH